MTKNLELAGPYVQILAINEHGDGDPIVYLDIESVAMALGKCPTPMVLKVIDPLIPQAPPEPNPEDNVQTVKFPIPQAPPEPNPEDNVQTIKFPTMDNPMESGCCGAHAACHEPQDEEFEIEDNFIERFAEVCQAVVTGLVRINQRSAAKSLVDCMDRTVAILDEAFKSIQAKS
jgi:predicted component of type VI protein secretion system